MSVTTVTFDSGDTATVGHLGKDFGALYDFGHLGKIHAKSAYLGQPDRRAVCISLGKPGDKSGYSLTGLHVDDYLMTGAVMCSGYDMTPHPHPHSPGQYPLDSIDDPAVRTLAADLLSDIARHYYSSVNP